MKKFIEPESGPSFSLEEMSEIVKKFGQNPQKLQSCPRTGCDGSLHIDDSSMYRDGPVGYMGGDGPWIALCKTCDHSGGFTKDHLVS
jgi:hypothetical protein